MSVPNEILDSLLSGYLDDALTPDERARVEQLLSSDANVRHELDSMSELREMLQSIDRFDRPRVAKLIGSDFSDRVVDAAIECARNEGVPEDHPLLRSTEAPSYRRDHSRRGRRLAVAILALAASGLIGAVIYAPQWNAGDVDSVANRPLMTEDNTSGSDVASLDNRSQDDSANMAALNRDPNPSSNDQEIGVTSDSNSSERIASSVAANVPAVMPRADQSPAVEPVEAESPSAVAAAASGLTTTDMVAATSNGALMTVMVLDVRRTELGRVTNPIRKALEMASIGDEAQQPVDGKIVSSITSAVRELQASQSLDAAPANEEVTGSVMYIEASAKRIDRFINTLMADRDGIESVGMNLAMDAPLSNVVRSIEAIDAVKIRDSQVVEFSGQLQGTSRELVRHLGKQTFMPWSREFTPTSDNGPDFAIRIFVLVH